MRRLLLAVCLLLPVTAWAQPDGNTPSYQTTAADVDPPAHISFVDGRAVIERDGKIDDSPANMPLLAGDRVRTETGRVEILFADGSTLHLDHHTTVDFQSDELVRVLDGRIRLTIGGRARDVSYRLDAAHAWAQIAQPGEYRLALMRRDADVEVELAVLRGGAELINEDGRTPLRAGERAFARRGVAPSYAYVFNSASWDAFDRWSEERRDYRLGLSSQYLPEDVRPYSRAFDRYGSWRHEPSYGYVWYPTVAVDWRPYHYGRWVTLRPYGWTWIGSDPWAWPTHHYGRWGFSAGSWFWIPGRTWGPAWVSWGYHTNYVSWCPLGWNNRPVFSLVNINFYRGYDPWRGWTVLPRHHFGYGYVHRAYIPGHRLDVRVRNAFQYRDHAPEIRGYAVPRSASAIRAPGRAVPRGGRTDAPVYTNLSPDDARVRTPGQRIQVGPPAGAARPRGGAGATDDAAAPGRAVSRDPGVERPRLTPERGVRSMPREVEGSRVRESEGPRVRESEGSRVRESEGPRVRESEGSRVRESEGPRVRESEAVRPDMGTRQRATPRSGDPSNPRTIEPSAPPAFERAVPRYRTEPGGQGAREPGGQGAGDPGVAGGARRPPDGAIRSEPRSADAPVYRAPERANPRPYERAAPPSAEPPSYRERAMPRREPDRPMSAPPPQRAEPERRAAPPPSADAPSRDRGGPAPGGRTRPGGGDSGSAGTARRRG